MLSLRSVSIAVALVVSGLALGCERKPHMKNMVMDTGRSVDTRTYEIRPGKVIGPEPVSPAAPPSK
jgi:hypothetical protein